MSAAAEPLASSTHDEKHFEGARLVQTKPELEHTVDTDHGVADAPAGIPPPPADPIDDLPMHQVIRLLRGPVSGHAANSSSRSSAARRVQRTIGNRASRQIVMRSHVVQRQCPCGGTCAKCQEEEQQRQIQRAVQCSSAATEPAEFDGIPASTGEQLDPATRRPMEAHFGADLADVRVHTGSEAAKSATSLDALAYTSGRDIYFASGMYAPSSDSGRRLLAHEVAHVVQQGSGAVPSRIAAKSSHGIKVGAPDDPLEAQAAVAAQEFVTGDVSMPLQKSPTVPAMPQRSATRDTIQRNDIAEQPLIDSKTFYENHRASIWGDLLEPFSGVHFDPGSPYAYWLFGRNDAFIYDTFVPISLQGWSTLVATAAPGDVDAAIRRGRDAPNNGLAPDEYNKGVAAELRNLYLPRVQDSLNRISPQFVGAEYLAMNLELEAGRTFSNAMLQPRPDSHLLVPSHPLDKFTIAGLMGGFGPTGQLQVNYEQYEASGAAATIYSELKTVRPVRFIWQVEQATWLWVRVIDPPNATAEETANELYGDPSLANGLIPASPLFGFTPSLLTPKHFEEWKTVAGDNATPSSALTGQLMVGHDPIKSLVRQGEVPLSMDPAMELLQSNSSDEAALNQVKGGKPTGASKEQIIARLRICLQLLDQISNSAWSMGGSEWFQGSRAGQKIGKRIEALSHSTDPTAAMRWDIHSQAEFELLKAVANGIKTATDIYKGFNAPFDPRGYKDLPTYVRGPLLATVKAYVDAADVADLVQTANERLQIAEEKSKLYPIEVLEGILEYCRGILKDQKRGFGSGEDNLGQQDLRKKEQELRERLASARELILRDPQQVQALIADIQNEVGDLQDEATMMNSLDAIVQEWNFLLDHRSFVGEFTGKDDRYSAAMEVLSEWYFRFYPIYLKYRTGRAEQRAEGRRELQDLSKASPHLEDALQAVERLASSEEEREHWITLGLRIAAVIGIGLVTAGIGSFVSEGLLVGAGWGLTTEGVVGAAIVSSGVEAGSFTTLSTKILGRDPNQSLLSTFLENWALFGALKGISLGLEASLGAKYATFTVRGGGNITAALAVQIGYSLAREKATHGGKLSDVEAQSIVAENLIVFIGTAIVGRYAGAGFFEGAAVRGERAFRGSFLAVDQGRRMALDTARQLSKTSTIDQTKRALSLDSEAIQKEIDAIKTMEEFAKSDPAKARLLQIDPAKLAEARDLNQAQIDARIRTSLALDLTSEGGTLFSCKPGKLAEFIEGYRKLGDTVHEEVNPTTGEKSAIVNTKDGQTMTIREQQVVEAKPPDSERSKLTTFYDSLSSEEARDEFSAILAESGPERAVQSLEGMAKSKDGLEAMLNKRAQARAARVPSAQKIAAAEQILSDGGFLENPLVKDDIADRNRGGLRGKVAEFLSRRANLTEFQMEEGYKVLSDIDVVQQFGNFKTLVEAVAAHPDEVLPLYELDGKVWRRMGDIDVLVLQQDSSGKSRIARMEEVKATPSATGKAAREQIGGLVKILEKIAGGDTTYQVHLNRKQNITGEIDFSSATPEKAKVRGLEGKKGFALSIGLTDQELNAVVTNLISPASKEPTK
jgi:hypothetical protein